MTSEKSSEDCLRALEQMYRFLDHEIDEASRDEIRVHLAECEPCLDQFDIEAAIKALVHRCCGSDVAPERLRTAIVAQLTVIRSSTTYLA